ncbi:hypothetical protein Trydic_g4962, partial [Trypoxylus dichotomus]
VCDMEAMPSNMECNTIPESVVQSYGCECLCRKVCEWIC